MNREDQENQEKLELIASKEFEPYSFMYKVVDFLNKNLKDQNLMFGLTKTSNGNMQISIYKT